MEHSKVFMQKVLPDQRLNSAMVMADELRWLEIPWHPR